MAVYSKEQRDRAVDLYERYDFSPTAVIHELGYPSEPSLKAWHRDREHERATGEPSTRGARRRRYTDAQKHAAVDDYLSHGRCMARTMRRLGYPKSKTLLMAWIDELAPGQRKLRHGPVPEELKRKAVVAVASGRLKSREAAAELGVEASVVRNWKRQMLAGSKETPVTKERKGKAGNGRPVARPVVPDAPTAAGGSRDAAGLADAVASLERRLAETRARLDELDADIERQRREKTELDIEIAIRKSALELLGKEPGADPENLTNREKTLLVRTVSETLGVTARSLLPVVGIARSTYHYQLNAMKRPDKDASLLELVRETFENSRRRYGYKRIHLELKGMGVRVSAKRIMRLMTGKRPGAPVQEREAVQLVQGRADQSASESGEPRLPRRAAEHAVGHGSHGVLDPRGQGLPVARDRLLRRASGRMDDRHQPQRGVGQRHARRRVLHAQGRREANHPFRPWMPL